MSHIFVDDKKCKRDGYCAAVCPAYVIEMPTKESVPVSVSGADELCIKCGHCVAICPHEAISLAHAGPADCEPVDKSLAPSYSQVEYLLKSRRSIRVYKDENIDKSILEKLIGIASRAPSGHNSQPVQWLVIQDKAEVNRLARLVCDWMCYMIDHQPAVARIFHFDSVVAAFEKGRDRILRGAPHLVIAHAPKNLMPAQAACIIAITYLELAAWSAGLGACWAGYFTSAAATYQPLIHALGLPEGHQVFGAMMLGRRKYEYHRIPPRKSPVVQWR